MSCAGTMMTPVLTERVLGISVILAEGSLHHSMRHLALSLLGLLVQRIGGYI